MTVNSEPSLYPFMLEPDFVQLLNRLLAENDTGEGVIFNFRDPTYSPETGGFHPVEICIDDKGVLQYVTDFAYFGRELEKELDFDFSMGLFQQFGRDHELVTGQGLFRLYTRNFCAYHKMGVYQVTATPL